MAIGRIVGDVFFDESPVKDPGWPWLVPVEITAKVDLIRDGIPLDQLNVARELTKSVRRHSHIRLTPAEFEEARRRFGI